MMFTELLAAKIVAGKKTVTRRVLSDNPRSPWYRNRSAGERYPVGKVFTVNPGRGVRRVAECEVTARHRQVLGAMDDDDARAEGFDNLADFVTAWKKINGSWDPAEVVDVVAFKLIEKATRHTVRLTVEVLIEVRDPDVIERVTGPAGDEWRSQLYDLHTEDDVLQHLAFNCAVNGCENARLLDGWADLPPDAVSMQVLFAEHPND